MGLEARSMMKNHHTCLACSAIVSFALASLPPLALAKVESMTLKELVAGSDLIVVAKVSRVEDAPADTNAEDKRFSAVRVATAEVIETWKGAPVREIQYLASSTWTCDISDAKKGEEVVLFLTRTKGGPGLEICHSGRGRMPLRVVRGRTYATLWVFDVRLPEGTATIPGLEPEYSFIRSVELAKLKELVRPKGP
jgi:hypothetical protein